MYVCLCHGFTDRQVRACAADGACSVAKIYRQLGGPPQCGKCVPMVRQMLKAVSGSNDDGEPLPAAVG